MASLYEIDGRILALINEETGEITDFEQLDKLQMERENKVENIALLIKNLKAEESSYKAEKEAFEERQRKAKFKRESLEQYLLGFLNGEKFKTNKVECSFRKSQRVVVDDVFLLPEEYIRYKEPDADKTAIKEAIKEGKEIAGATLIEVLNLQIK